MSDAVFFALVLMAFLFFWGDPNLLEALISNLQCETPSERSE